jgi:signal transduction histidine kinase
VLSLVAVMGLTMYALVRTVLADRIHAELVKRGVVIASCVQQQAADPLITRDLIGLQLTLTEVLRQDEDIRYLFVEDYRRRVVVHTFQGSFPPELEEQTKVESHGEFVLTPLTSDEKEPIDDIMVPVMGGVVGYVHVGLSTRSVEATLRQIIFTLLQLLGVTSFLAAGGGAAVSWRIMRPFRVLVDGVQRVGRGDLALRVPVSSGGEIGRLVTAFNQMVSALADDMERRQTAEEALSRAKEDLERRNRDLRTMDRVKDGIIRDVSHELKTPVAKQAMQLEMLRELLRGRELPPEVGRSLEAMEANVARQERDIRNILDLTRLEAGGRIFRHEPVDLHQLLAGVVEDYRMILDRYGFRVTLRLGTVRVTSDPEMLRHLFANLVDNVVKYRRSGVGPLLEAELALQGREAVVRLADNGRGMTREQMERAFDRFYQADPSCHGSGVGLAICRSIIRGLGGEIRLDSEGLDRGTTIWVRIPVDRTS